MSALSSTVERLCGRVLTSVDALGNRLYGQRYNPLYQSGTIVVALYLVLVITGLWLLLFYRVGAPWQSVANLTASPWTGRWVRGLHRYATDAALVATLVHAFRMFAQGRTWGARTLAWISGCVLLLLVLLCGWTGYVMVWDAFGGQLAAEGARMLDSLPMLSEPTSRAFTGETPLPTAFFFLNLFAHIGLPLGMGVVFWLHVKRLARPAMLPSRPLMWTAIGVLTMAAIVWPVPMAPEADPLHLPERVTADLLFGFWIPISRRLQGGHGLLLAVVIGTTLVSVPWLTARRGAAAAPASHVDEEICVGCVQCSLDCPYGAIAMLPRDSKRSPLVARVDPDLCVSCGICSGSCPPMGVGPPGRTGRDQLLRVRTFISEESPAGQIVFVACGRGAGTFADALERAGAHPYPVNCAGNLHTSAIELLLRGGAAGVLILSCPPRDCSNREGPRWLGDRIYGGREAELHERVNRARIRVVAVNAAERARALSALADFAADLDGLEGPVGRVDEELSTECEPAEVREDE